LKNTKNEVLILDENITEKEIELNDEIKSLINYQWYSNFDNDEKVLSQLTKWLIVLLYYWYFSDVVSQNALDFTRQLISTCIFLRRYAGDTKAYGINGDWGGRHQHPKQGGNWETVISALNLMNIPQVVIENVNNRLTDLRNKSEENQKDEAPQDENPRKRARKNDT